MTRELRLMLDRILPIASGAPDDVRSEMGSQQHFVYGISAGSLVFIPRRVAADLARLRETIHSASTYGEARRTLPEHLYRRLAEQLTDGRGYPPADGERLIADEIPGHADGDWPEWPKQEMLRWLPRNLQVGYGRVESSVINGDYLELDANRADALVAELATDGIDCTRDDSLVALASGHKPSRQTYFSTDHPEHIHGQITLHDFVILGIEAPSGDQITVECEVGLWTVTRLSDSGAEEVETMRDSRGTQSFMLRDGLDAREIVDQFDAWRLSGTKLTVHAGPGQDISDGQTSIAFSRAGDAESHYFRL